MFFQPYYWLRATNVLALNNHLKNAIEPKKYYQAHDEKQKDFNLVR